jgi:hypothetical protein
VAIATSIDQMEPVRNDGESFRGEERVQEELLTMVITVVLEHVLDHQ